MFFHRTRLWRLLNADGVFAAAVARFYFTLARYRKIKSHKTASQTRPSSSRTPMGMFGYTKYRIFSPRENEAF